MSKLAPLGITRLAGLHYYVRDLERSRRFYVDRLDFAETWRSSPDLEARGRQRSAAFTAGDVAVVVSSPIAGAAGPPSRAARFLAKHPDGVGTLVFEVEDVDHAFRELEARGGTPIDEIHDLHQRRRHSAPVLDHHAVRRHHLPLRRAPGLRAAVPGRRGGGRRPAQPLRLRPHRSRHVELPDDEAGALWMEHVLGLEQLWQVAFHTSDVDPGRQTGSGLKSIVMWDPTSQVKFANNEPARPFFKASQINIFNEELRGDGVQHAR
jgi:4-hydroxyphenylpyruvate dioxygenase